MVASVEAVCSWRRYVDGKHPNVSAIVPTCLCNPTAADRRITYFAGDVMDGIREFVVLQLDELRIALPLAVVERVIRATYVVCLPQAPDIVLGVVNVQGRIIPIVNTRRRFRLPHRDIALTDQFVIARTQRRPVALMADAVSGVLAYPEQDIVAADVILPGMEYVEGVARIKDGLILIHNLDTFLSLDEEKSLDRAMSTVRDE